MGKVGRKPLRQLQSKWEADLGVDNPDTTWAKLVERAWKSTCNARFQLIHFYTLHRAYLTPVQIHKYFHTDAARCPRCSSEEAELIHMLWSCSKLGTYWEEVLAFLCV